MNERNLIKLEKQIIDLAQKIQQLVNREFEQVNWQPKPESALAQLGLRNGFEIINDYINYKEAGLALEHLLYMVDSLETSLSNKDCNCLVNIAEQLKMSKVDVDRYLK